MEKGAQITAEVVDTAPKRSPLIQGGLEILIDMTIFWDNAEHTETLKNKIGSINFIVYNDSSKAILTEMQAVIDEDEDEDENSDSYRDNLYYGKKYISRRI